jgi:hypothetical protein
MILEGLGYLLAEPLLYLVFFLLGDLITQLNPSQALNKPLRAFLIGLNVFCFFLPWGFFIAFLFSDLKKTLLAVLAFLFWLFWHLTWLACLEIKNGPVRYRKFTQELRH